MVKKQKVERRPEAPRPTVRTARQITITLPVAEPEAEVNVSRHVEVRLNRQQAVAMRWLLDGSFGRRMKSGRLVQSNPDLIRAMLDKVYGELEHLGS